MGFADFMGFSCEEENTFTRRSLTSINMGPDADITDMVEGDRFVYGYPRLIVIHCHCG